MTAAGEEPRGAVKCTACGKAIASPREMRIRKGLPFHASCKAPKK